MRLTIEDVFERVTTSEFEALYFDEDFNVALSNSLQMGRAVLHFERTSERITRHLSYEPHRDPNTPAGQALGNTRASFVEQMEWNVQAKVGHWKTIPNLFPERVRNSGTLELVAVSSSRSGEAATKRIVRGEVKVSAFGFGGIIERMIVAEIEKNYVATTKFTREWLAQKR